MSGKSVYLKSVAIALLLAHTGMGVPASEFRCSVFTWIATSFHGQDNVLEGISYFLSEVKRLKEIAELLGDRERSLILLDEVLSGTNPEDATVATRALIHAFRKRHDTRFVISTHLIELANEFDKHQFVWLGSFGGWIEGGVAKFDYRLQSGVSRQRLGMQLLNEQRVIELFESA